MFEIGFLNVAWWAPIGFFFLSGHLTNVATTVYLHRAMTHRGVRLHGLVSFPMRLWLWLSTGTVTKEWVACHRRHHAYADREGDPHSPVLEGLSAIVFRGWAYYRHAVKDQTLIEQYGKHTPNDWIERNVFSRFSYFGVLILLIIDVVLFGWAWGIGLWIGQVVWMPFLGGLVNGVGHAWGYRNYFLKDSSRNFFPFGLLLGGEELHNNHHADPRSARFRRRWFEFDIGWVYIKLLSIVRLAKIEYAARSLGPAVHRDQLSVE
jgi:stearoyl-CoA desaturase (Delta-9 desaturase)